MARKKQARGIAKEPTREPAPDDAPSAQAAPNPLELAVPVAEVVQILSVALRRGSIESDPRVFTNRDAYQVRITIEGIEHHFDSESHSLVVTTSFSLNAVRRDDDTEPPGLSIRASFDLTYDLPPSAGFEETQFKAFAMTNGVFNVWPYWREYVQSTTSRMGLPPIVAPVFRL